ncbi:MAG: hypothetical protein ACLFNY_00005, partial [Candidatus Aenigmatarchaeota archaeon]
RVPEPVLELEIIDLDEEVKEGEEVTVKYSVTMLKDIEEPESVRFLVYDERENKIHEDSQEVTSEGEYEFTWTGGEKGDYTMVITSEVGLDERTVSVEEEREMTWILPLVISIAAAAVILILVLSKMKGEKKLSGEAEGDVKGIHLFSVKVQDPEEVLDSGLITEIREAFADEDHDLDENAKLYEEDGKWWISEKGEKKFRVKAEDDELLIYLL